MRKHISKELINLVSLVKAETNTTLSPDSELLPEVIFTEEEVADLKIALSSLLEHDSGNTNHENLLEALTLREDFPVSVSFTPDYAKELLLTLEIIFEEDDDDEFIDDSELFDSMGEFVGFEHIDFDMSGEEDIQGDVGTVIEVDGLDSEIMFRIQRKLYTSLSFNDHSETDLSREIVVPLQGREAEDFHLEMTGFGVKNQSDMLGDIRFKSEGLILRNDSLTLSYLSAKILTVDYHFNFTVSGRQALKRVFETIEKEMGE
jgi:hypothetical protein